MQVTASLDLANCFQNNSLLFYSLFSQKLSRFFIKWFVIRETLLYLKTQSPQRVHSID